MLFSLLNSVKTTLVLVAIVIVCFTPLPACGLQLWADRDNTEAIAFLSPKIDDNFANILQHEEQTAVILRAVAVRGSGRIELPNC